MLQRQFPIARAQNRPTGGDDALCYVQMETRIERIGPMASAQFDHGALPGVRHRGMVKPLDEPDLRNPQTLIRF